MEDRKLLNLLMAEIFNAVTDESFLKVRFSNGEKTKGDVYEGSTKLDGAEVLVLAEQSRDILKTRAYVKIMKSMKAAANHKMYAGQETDSDMVFGKAVLWTLDVMNEKLKNISSLRYSDTPAKEQYKELLPKDSLKKKK